MDGDVCCILSMLLVLPATWVLFFWQSSGCCLLVGEVLNRSQSIWVNICHSRFGSILTATESVLAVKSLGGWLWDHTVMLPGIPGIGCVWVSCRWCCWCCYILSFSLWSDEVLSTLVGILGADMLESAVLFLLHLGKKDIVVWWIEFWHDIGLEVVAICGWT